MDMSNILVLTSSMTNNASLECVICKITNSTCNFCPARCEIENGIITRVIGFCSNCRRDTKKQGNMITRNDVLSNEAFSDMKECMSKAYKRKMGKWPENNSSKI